MYMGLAGRTGLRSCVLTISSVWIVKLFWLTHIKICLDVLGSLSECDKSRVFMLRTFSSSFGSKSVVTKLIPKCDKPVKFRNNFWRWNCDMAPSRSASSTFEYFFIDLSTDVLRSCKWPKFAALSLNTFVTLQARGSVLGPR